MSFIGVLNWCLRLMLVLFLCESNGLPTETLLKENQPAGNQGNNPTVSISHKECKEYSKWTRPHVAINSPEFVLSLSGEIEQCGITDESTQSGVAQVGEVPHLALIGSEKEGEMKYACAGSLISEDFVLTSGYCAKDFTITNDTGFFVRLGGIHRLNLTEDEVQRIRVTEIIVHPKYVFGEAYNDLALVRLERPVKLSWHVRPICLHTGEPVNKLPLVTAGWKRDLHRQYLYGYSLPTVEHLHELLRKVKLVETPYEVCKVPYDIRRDYGKMIKNGVDNSTMICATYPLGHDSLCSSDGGGPLYIRSQDSYCSYQLVGVVGFGGVCKTIPEVPSVFTRVAPFIPWIEAVVWHHNTSLPVEPFK